MNRRMARLAGGGLLAAGLACMLAGCEGGGGGQWDDFDFGANDRNVCVALGDSITAGSGLSSYAQCYVPKVAGMLPKNIINRAIPGAESSVGVDLVHSSLDTYRPGFLIILFGINDLIMGYSESSAVANLRFIVRAAKDNKTAPIIATLTPVAKGYVGHVSGVQRLNAAIRQMAAEEGAYLVDLEGALHWNSEYLQADGLHPNAAGHDVMAGAFFDQMN